jgi:ABC-type polysaccharide/polyol phosphate transport system ATPase subunit
MSSTLRRSDDSAPETAESDEFAVSVRDVHKQFRLFSEKETSLKATIVRGRRSVYEEFEALKGVSFDVARGEVLGIIGRNGSGKSTLLKCMARILEPDSGTIVAEGRVAALLEVGAGFHPEYSAIENIFLSGAIYGVRREDLEARVDEIIRFAELERFSRNPE